jgi:hypothetical protein
MANLRSAGAIAVFATETAVSDRDSSTIAQDISFLPPTYAMVASINFDSIFNTRQIFPISSSFLFSFRLHCRRDLQYLVARHQTDEG